MLLYASKHHDIKTVVNLSGRYDLKAGIEERLGKDYLERITNDGFIEVKTRSGKVRARHNHNHELSCSMPAKLLEFRIQIMKIYKFFVSIYETHTH